MDYDNYPTQGACADGPSMLTQAVRMPTLQQRLDVAVANAEQRLAEAKEARDILARNPDLEKLLNFMQRGNF